MRTVSTCDMRPPQKCLTSIGCATRPDVRPNTHAVGSDPILVRHFWGGRISQVLTVLIQKENRAHRSLSMNFDQESDTTQDVVEGCANENHLERIEYPIVGQGSRGRWGCWKRLPVG